MTDIRYIASVLSTEDILCQLAEEASELAQAALKLRRARRDTHRVLSPSVRVEDSRGVCRGRQRNQMVETISGTAGRRIYKLRRKHND
jgi:hypothetical protein